MASIIKANQLQDFGGNSILTSDGAGNVTVNAQGLQNTPSFYVYKNAVQAVANNTETVVTWQVERFDTDSACDTSTNYRFTVPSGKAGKYFICASLNAFTSTNDQNLFEGLIYKNGSYIANNLWQYSTAANAGRHNAYSQAIVVDLAASDYIELYGRIAGGSTEQFRRDDRSMLLSGYRIGS